MIPSRLPVQNVPGKSFFPGDIVYMTTFDAFAASFAAVGNYFDARYRSFEMQGGLGAILNAGTAVAATENIDDRKRHIERFFPEDNMLIKVNDVRLFNIVIHELNSTILSSSGVLKQVSGQGRTPCRTFIAYYRNFCSRGK